MRCNSCNKVLSDFEATRFDPVMKKYPDLCNTCIPSVIRDRCRERTDLSQDAYDDIVDENEHIDYDMFDSADNLNT